MMDKGQKDSQKGNSDLNRIYKKMVEEIQDYAIILLNKDGLIQNWNKGAQRIKLYREEEVIGKHFSIFYYPDDIAGNLPERLLNEALKKGTATHEGWRKRKDNSGFWGNVVITALYDDNKDIIGFVKITRDLTERKTIENNLRISEERYLQTIAEVQDYAIIRLNIKGIIENWNIGAEKIKGYRSDEIIGKHFSIFYVEDDIKSDLPGRLLREAVINNKATHEGWRVKKDGTRFWGAIVITALHDRNGDVIGFSKVTRDLTDKKIADEKLMAYTRELEIQNYELEQFAYVASHDLQEPLRKIETFAGLIEDHISEQDFVKKYLEKMKVSAGRMKQLVRSLLSYSRLSKGEAKFESVDLNQVLKEVKEDFELLINEKGAKIIADKLPSVTGDAVQLGQLFSNLLSNSLKFSVLPPKIRISSRITTLDRGVNDADFTGRKFLELTFEDNGIGFEQQYDKVIFSLFQRLHGRQDYEGTGIGLALCKRIVENHKGFIAVTSEPDKGTRFFVYLPLKT